MELMEPMEQRDPVDTDEDERLAAIAPEIIRITVSLLRRVAGLYPEERVPQEALLVADGILDRYGVDGLRLLTMTLTGWAAVEIEREAQASGRTLQSVLDEMELTRLEVEVGEWGAEGQDGDREAARDSGEGGKGAADRGRGEDRDRRGDMDGDGGGRGA
ncbi:hypothetical protein [Streptomyces sp. MUM 2J]|uniref:hypothetical protein n=1 Tax=Streptomyces sp. MUM 2J TaxID=2791987 RepID=UPI001F043833|nr:hypothetical protein [Streptomyces sp. MUM 2J]MCH0563169.1 hypothetical protein [Streptomyces sp. MUM 2J]